MMEPYWKNLCVQRCENIKKDSHDTNSYRGLVLLNEMKVLLISNPTTPSASCTMSVNVGSFSDPYDLPGLAHLCERMLVLGTQKYPLYRGFSNFVTQHGGEYQGTTKGDQTFYYFKINTMHFKDALLQYVHLFLTPLFNEDWIREEIDIIDREHNEMLMDDYCRLSEFIKSTARFEHPYSRFTFGNKRSLQTIPFLNGTDLRRRLVEFYNKYYSANIMSLCVFSNEPLDKIEEMVVNLFCMVENKNIEIPIYGDHPFKEQFCTTWYIIPNQDMRFLKIVFPLPDVISEYWIPAVNFIIMLLEYEGEGSLFAVLRDSQLFSNITIFRELCTRDINFLVFEVIINENGIMYLSSFIDLLFEYLNMVKGECNLVPSTDQLLLQLYEIFINQGIEYNSNMRYYNYENTYGIAATLRLYPMEKVLMKDKPGAFYDITWECNQDIMTWILSRYVSPQNIRVYVLAKEFGYIVNDISPEWSGDTIFKEEKIPEDVIRTWKNISHSRFRLPSLDGFRMQYDLSLYDL